MGSSVTESGTAIYFRWDTLAGRVEKEAASTPGGIAKKYVEWVNPLNGSPSCPTPGQPDVAFGDDPYEDDPN